MKFKIKSIKIKEAKEAILYPQWKLLIAKILKLKLVEKIDVKFEIEVYIDTLLPNHHIQIGGTLYMVIARNPNNNTTYHIIPHQHLTRQQIEFALQQKDGRIMFHSAPDLNFKRLKY